MDEVTLLATRLEQTFVKAEEYGSTLKEGAFHGPSLTETLEGVTFGEAHRRVIPGRHTIWEIVNHCTFWMKEFANALKGSPILDVDQFEDWPVHGSTEGDWAADVEELVASYNVLRNRLLEVEEGQLDTVVESFFHGKVFRFTLRKMLYGAIDHNLYHAGQISLLKSTT